MNSSNTIHDTKMTIGINFMAIRNSCQYAFHRITLILEIISNPIDRN